MVVGGWGGRGNFRSVRREMKMGVDVWVDVVPVLCMYN